MEENISVNNQPQSNEKINSIEDIQSTKITKINKFLKVIIIIFIIIIISLIIYIFQTRLPQSKTITSTFQNTEQDSVTPEKEITPSISTKQKSNISVFQEGSTLYFSNSENNKIKITDNVGYYSISSDKSKIAYALSWSSTPLDPSIYIYKISDGSTENFPTGLEITPSLVNWSPNDNYLVVNSGTDVVRNIRFYKYPNKNSIFEIQLYAINDKKSVEWVSDTDFVYNEPQEVNPEIPAGAGYSTNISKINILTKQKEILKKADGFTMYRISKVENNMIYFNKQTVTTSSEWFVNDKTTSWKMDINGNNLVEI